MPDKEQDYAAGLEIRRKMWGKAGADDRIESASDFNRPAEDFVTRFCFGEVWTRPELDHKTRSLLTIGLLAVLAKPTQLRSHVRGAIANGATVDEIREVLIHVMVYGGVPAAVDAMIHARETLQEMGLDA